jgi:dipeptidyl aminopeptidase/acylaminoacyl peptidase
MRISLSSAATAPYGSWRSPIDPALVASVGRGHASLYSEIQWHSGDIYWIAPQTEGSGRQAIVRLSPDGTVHEITPQGFSARSRVHEYGGGVYCVFDKTVYFSNYTDQRLYRLAPGEEPEAITPAPDSPSSLRYADGSVTPDGRTLICIRERHTPSGEVLNDIALIPTDVSDAPQAIFSGRDFYAAPRISPDGGRLCWLTWDHPNMPWDGNELWMAELDPNGAVAETSLVAGGVKESILQPMWSPQGILHFISDRTGWWNLYREQNGEIVPLAPVDADLGLPQWSFGNTSYAFLAGDRIACIYRRDGVDHLGILDANERQIDRLDIPLTAYLYLCSDEAHQLWAIAGDFQTLPSVIRIDSQTGRFDVLQRPHDLKIAQGYLSMPKAIEFPTGNGAVAHALYYPVSNKDFQGPTEERPPLIIQCHGGPTDAARSHLQLDIQYWTSRGFALVDVNYGGSAGFGRAYRSRLEGRWGEVDVEDCINAALYLVQMGEVDGERLIMRGRSAGGFTALHAITRGKAFHAAAIYSGISDLKALTHEPLKFESHYLHTLIGSAESPEEILFDRSPIHRISKVSCPMILFQGLRDQIVSPQQAQVIVDALLANHLPFAYLPFPDEGHSFRKGGTIQRCLEAELSFYSQTFDFGLSEPIKPVLVENLNRDPR